MSLRNNCVVVLDLIIVVLIYVMFISWEWFMEVFNLLNDSKWDFNSFYVGFWVSYLWNDRDLLRSC